MIMPRMRGQIEGDVVQDKPQVFDPKIRKVIKNEADANLALYILHVFYYYWYKNPNEFSN